MRCTSLYVSECYVSLSIDSIWFTAITIQITQPNHDVLLPMLDIAYVYTLVFTFDGQTENSFKNMILFSVGAAVVFVTIIYMPQLNRRAMAIVLYNMHAAYIPILVLRAVDIASNMRFGLYQDII